jgi:hypothetical protein
MAAEDEPLWEYLLECKETGPPRTFEADMRRHVQQGADPERMHSLHLALQCGITSEAHYRLLVELGADPKGKDALGLSALHGAQDFSASIAL